MTQPETQVIPYQDPDSAVIEFNVQQRDLIRRMYAPEGVTDDEFTVFLEVAKRSGLNPFNKQIYIIARGQGDNRKATIQVAIDGYRLIGQRTGAHTGSKIWWARADGDWLDIPINDCQYAKCVVTRDGNEFEKVVAYDEYVQTKAGWSEGSAKGSKPDLQIPTEMWVKMRANQLGKCAEAGALRMAFPAEMSGIFVDAEEAAMERVARVEATRAALRAPERRTLPQGGSGSVPRATSQQRPTRGPRPLSDAPGEAPATTQPSEDGTTPWPGFWTQLSATMKELKRDGNNPRVGDIVAALSLAEGAGMKELQEWYAEGGSIAEEALQFATDALEGQGFEKQP